MIYAYVFFPLLDQLVTTWIQYWYQMVTVADTNIGGLTN
jgi:hypothetical protein